MTDVGDIRIGRALEDEQEKQDIGEVQDAVKTEILEDSGAPDSSETRNILIGVAVLIGIFVVVFGGFKLYDNLTSAAVIDIDELHDENLEGDLNNEEAYVYNGFSFVLVDGLWWTEVLKSSDSGDTLLKIPLHYGPRDLEEVVYTGSVSE